MLAHMAPGTLAVDMSSITPEEAKACHRFAGERGIHFLDAPVSGGEPKAIDGTLAFMIGGTQEAFEAASPLLEYMGTSLTLVGEGGAGCVTKLANQIIVNLTIAAVSEALVLATKAGADPEKVYQAIRGGLAGQHRAGRQGAHDAGAQLPAGRQAVHQHEGHQKRAGDGASGGRSAAAVRGTV